MQSIIVERPYQFVPPHRGNLAPSLIQAVRLVDHYLNRFEGITSFEVRGAELLRASIDRGDGIVLAPNHCRYADPVAMGWVARAAKTHVFAMASWHLFNQSWLQSLAIRLCGGFSVYREGLDRQSLDTAIEILVNARRPLVVFPEGTVFRSNDILQPLLDGVAFLARSAAKRRAKRDGGQVVIHPVAIKYVFHGDLEKTLHPVLSKLEARFQIGSPYAHDKLVPRIERLNKVMLAIKEVDHLGQAQSGPIELRKQRLMEHLLTQLEEQWSIVPSEHKVIPRIKALRIKLVPELLKAEKASPRRDLIWDALYRAYSVQQIASYPSSYLDVPTETRMLETVERIEEDVYDRSTIHRPLHAILSVGEAMRVSDSKPTRHEPDPIIAQLTTALERMLEQLSTASPIYTGA
ncbi:MAG: 1-acyl-sn-glycerol-3-phosphate acyltransferase [Planctomycetales bacterium]|nr:1-acyl-sn-glycerol-3-phosphate acyltransferase [Planctomycetales bacterium]